MKHKKDIQAIMAEENPELVDECASLSVEQLDARLAQCAKDSQAADELKEADMTYQSMKEALQEMGAPHRDAKKAIKLRSRYLIALIKERGGK